MQAVETATQHRAKNENKQTPPTRDETHKQRVKPSSGQDRDAVQGQAAHTSRITPELNTKR